MRNVVLSRIDERLIHGQVATQWITYVSCNAIYVIDEATAKNALLSKVILSVAPKGVEVKVLSTKDAILKLVENSESPKERLMLIAKVPGVFEQIIDSGVDLKEVNLGGMGLNKNRKPFYDNASASEEEVASMSRMIQKGVKVYYQVTPFQRSVDLQKIIK